MSEELAKKFHETYEKLAPEYGYKTREESAVKWEDVPDKNKKLMIKTCELVLQSQSKEIEENRELLKLAIEWISGAHERECIVFQTGMKCDCGKPEILETLNKEKG